MELVCVASSISRPGLIGGYGHLFNTIRNTALPGLWRSRSSEALFSFLPCFSFADFDALLMWRFLFIAGALGSNSITFLLHTVTQAHYISPACPVIRFIPTSMRITSFHNFPSNSRYYQKFPRWIQRSSCWYFTGAWMDHYTHSWLKTQFLKPLSQFWILAI